METSAAGLAASTRTAPSRDQITADDMDRVCVNGMLNAVVAMGRSKTPRPSHSSGEAVRLSIRVMNAHARSSIHMYDTYVPRVVNNSIIYCFFLLTSS